MQKKLQNSELYQNENGDWIFTVSMKIVESMGRLCLLKGLVTQPNVIIHVKVIRACNNPPVLIYCPPALVKHFEANAEELLTGAVRAANQMAAEDKLIEATRNMQLLFPQYVIRGEE